MSRPQEPAPSRLARDEVRDVVRGYVMRQVRAVVREHEELLAKATALYAHAEEGFLGDSLKVEDKLRELDRHPLMVAARLLLVGRPRRVLRTAIRLLQDNRRIMKLVDERVERDHVTTREEAERHYREVLVASVPLEHSLENAQAIADAFEMLADLLRSRHRLIRDLPRKGYGLARKYVGSEPTALEELDALWDAVCEDPPALQAVARSIRREGPRAVRAVYGEGQEVSGTGPSSPP